MRTIAAAAVLLLWMAARPSFVCAQSAAELLEKGIYAEETQGDLPAAIEIYKRIVAAADVERPTSAQALLRLGNCYLKSERKTDASATFDFLAKQYPEQKALVNKIPPKAGALPLLPAPWRDDEETLVLRRPGTEDGKAFLGQAGLLILRARQERSGNRTIARLENNWVVMRTTMTVDAETLRPIERSLNAERISFEHWNTSHRTSSIEFTHRKRDKSATYPLTAPIAYEFDELFQLIRCLPLAEGYATTVPVVGRTAPEVHEASIRIVGRETLSVPAGTFDALVIDVSMAPTYIADSLWHGIGTKRIWYSADAKRYPLRIRQGPQTWDLAQIRVGTAQTSVRDDRTSATLDAPHGWVVVSGNKPDLPLLIVPPDLSGVGFLTREPQLSPSVSSSQMAAVAVEAMATKQLVREGPEEVTLSIGSATRLAIDYPITSGLMKVNDRFFVSRPECRLILSFTSIAPESWAALKPSIDDIARSLRLN
jgi:hypothetical protein